MVDYVTLLGAEDVKQAGHMMSQAALEIRQQVAFMSEALDRHARKMEECVDRIVEDLSVECPACSLAGGAGLPVKHLPPICNIVKPGQ